MQQLNGVTTQLETILQNQRNNDEQPMGNPKQHNQPPEFQGLRLAIPRIEFPRFEGENPMAWLYKANHFFAIHHTNPQHRIMLASYYMEDPAVVWF